MAIVDVNRLKESGQRFARGFTTGQKAVTVIGVVALVGASFVFMRWASTPSYAPLYANLDPSDAASVTDGLGSIGVPYKLADGGTAVMVPRNRVYDARVRLAAKGLPAGGHEGYSLLDKGGITQSEFSQNVNYQRALQGELSKTIEAISGVSRATVTLTIPRDTPFLTEKEAASAAVLVQPTRPDALSDETVQAIVHLVSSSVPNLAPGNVTVADSNGNVLAAPGDTGSALQSSRNDGKTAAFESNLSKKIEKLITTALGPGHAAVTVQAQLNFDQTTTKRETFQQPAATETLASSVSQNTDYSGPGGGSTGILGPDGQPLAGGATTPVSYTDQKADQKFALNSIEQIVNAAPGSIKSLSIAALLDSKVVKASDVAKWESLITAAAGIQAKRGDRLEVSTASFDDTAAKEAKAELAKASAAQSKNMMMSILRDLVTLLIVGLVLFLAWRSVKKAQANRVPVRVPIDLHELEAGSAADGAGDPTQVVRAVAPALAGGGGAAIEHQIGELIEHQPEEVAQTLRSWLADRRA
jgi:flagellar M-ring protein FliF